MTTGAEGVGLEDSETSSPIYVWLLIMVGNLCPHMQKLHESVASLTTFSPLDKIAKADDVAI